MAKKSNQIAEGQRAENVRTRGLLCLRGRVISWNRQMHTEPLILDLVRLTVPFLERRPTFGLQQP